MKKAVFLLLMLVCFYSNAQIDRKETTDTLTYVKTKEEAFTNILIWTTESFNDSNNAIKLKDKDLGIIIIKGITLSDDFSSSFTITIRFKDSKCLVSIKDWKETQYNYSYDDMSNCYTKSCKNNIERWSLTVDKLTIRFINKIKQEINN
jgi:hypothetical protein